MQEDTREELLRLVPEQDSISFARHPCVVASDKLARSGGGDTFEDDEELTIFFEEQLRDRQGKPVFAESGMPLMKRWRILAQEGSYIYYHGTPKRKVTRTEKILPFGDDQKTLVLSGYMVLKNGDLDRGSFGFSSYGFLKLMGKAPTAGSNHIWLHNSFIRLRRAVLQSRYIFVDPKTGAYIPKVRDTNLITDLDLIDIGDGKFYRESQLRIPCNSAAICGPLLTDLKSHLSVAFDLEFFRDLIPLADSIYRCINSALREGGYVYREDIFLWAKRLGLGPMKYPSDLMHSLKRAHASLRQWKWLRCDPEIVRNQEGGYEIVYKLNRKHRRGSPMDPLFYDPLFRELLKRGVNMTTSTRLLNERTRPHIEQKMEYFDFERAQKGENKIRSGWLVRAIEEDYTAPQGFVSRAEQERKERGAEERRRQNELAKKAEEEAHRKRLTEHIERRKNSRWSALWDGMAQRLRDGLGKSSFSTWIEPTLISKVEGNTVMLEVPNTFFGNWIREHYLEDIEQALSEIRGSQTTMDFGYPAEE